MRLPPLPSVRDILKVHSVSASKNLSQNFLLSQSVNDRIIRSANKSLKDCLVIEIGPGPGCLTRAILKAGARKVIGIEKDIRFEPMLGQLSDASEGTFKFIQGDVLETKYMDILNTAEMSIDDLKTKKVHIIGNLPFAISVPLLLQYIHMAHEKSGLFQCPELEMCLMFQKEVGERIVAAPNTYARSRLSVMSQSVFYPRISKIVESKDFFPKPDVDAAVVHFKLRKDNLLQASTRSLERIVKATFSHRNKHLKNTICDNLDNGSNLLEKAGIELTRRPVSLTNSEFCELAKMYEESQLSSKTI